MMKNLQNINASIRQERDCGEIEFWLRRFFSGIFYWQIYRRLNSENPYFTPQAINFLSRKLNKQMTIFEWGSGASTLWYAQKASQLISIEHDEKWYLKISRQLKAKFFDNVKLVYVPPEEENFDSYVQTILQYNDGYFDVISIDGRDRIKCVQHAINKLTISGYLILDDSHRSRYQPAFDLLKNFKKRRYNFGLLQTTIFQRN